MRRAVSAAAPRMQITNGISAPEARRVAEANRQEHGRWEKHLHAAFAKIRAAALRGDARTELTSSNIQAMNHIRDVLASDEYLFGVVMRTDGVRTVLAVCW